MNWLQGLVAPAAQFVASQQGQQGQQQPQQPYMGQPSPDAPPVGGYVPDASQWQVGTRTQGSTSGASASGVSASKASASGGSLEARCAQLENDVASLALFARTLLTMLEDAKVVTREQFMETKNRLDMLDGKMDDR